MEFDMSGIEVLHDNVLIEVTEPRKEKVGSIYLPEKSQNKKERVWEGVVHKIGQECEEKLKVGDKVIFDMAQSENFNEVFVICKEENIFAKIKD